MEDRGRSLNTVPMAALAALFLITLLTVPTKGLAAPATGLSDVRSALDSWDLAGAERHLKKRPTSAEKREHTVLGARLQLMRSDFKGVINDLLPIVSAYPKDFEARVLLGRALYATGRNDEALKILDVMATHYTNDEVSGARDLTWLGIGLHLTDYPKNAVTVFEEALQADPAYVPARIHLARLFVHKANYQDSDDLYKGVLAKAPGNIEALLGAARIDIESDRDYPAARKKVLAVLKRSPGCVPAHAVLARLDLLDEQPGDATKRLLAHSLKQAPNDPTALTILGASYLILDDDAHYAETRARALKLNPRFAAFFSTIAEHAARVHRYKRAIALNEEALKLNPEHWAALANLGIGYSRVGDDAKAKKYLEEAFYGDSYNVRTYNLLSVFYDKVIKEFDWVEVKPMRLRVHRSEKDVLERYVPPLLTEAFNSLKKKYGYTPSGPLHIEIFPDKELFSVRSTGLPRLGAHGICFGHVITSRSPSDGNYNWAEVLWHELSHVFHIQLSKSRVPRWFTEGLAVYESTEGRTQWRREMDPALAEYMRDGKLRGVADFNLSFTQARNLRDILVAYYHAFVVTDYIVQRFGFPKMRALLVAWGARKTTSEAFESVLGTSLADFDEAFKTWLQARLAPLNRNFSIDPHRFAKDAKRLLEAAAKDPKDAKAGTDAAMAVYAGGKQERALELVEKVLEQHPKHPRALFLRAKIRLRKKEFKNAGTDLEALLTQGLDGPEIRQALGFIAMEAKKPAEAIEQLKRAIATSPKDASLFRALLAVLDGEKKGREAYEWRKKLADIDQMSLKLVDTLLAAGPGYGATKAELLTWGEMGNHIAPFSIAHHVRFAEVLIGLGEKGKARFEVESALIIDPENAKALELQKKL